METRKCTEGVVGETNMDFARNLRNYVENCPTAPGYCYKRNPIQPISNNQTCGGGVKTHIGFMYTFSFTDENPSTLKIQWGTDFGMGFAIFVNDVYYIAYDPRDIEGDIWWDLDWDSPYVFKLDFTFEPGSHTIYTVGLEHCCDGPVEIRMNRNNQGWVPLSESNADCAINNNCDAECERNQYQDGPNCRDCDDICLTCEEQASNCTECTSDTRSLENGCECKPGYYQNGNELECEQCSQNCESCLSQNDCQICADTYYLSNGNCLQCDNQCELCENTSGYCVSCNLLDENRKNNPPFCDCEEGFYSSEDNSSCEQCVQPCQFCTNQNECISCISGYYLDGNQCLQCSYSCETCIQESTNCINCSSDSTRDQESCECLQNYYQFESESECKQCEPPCLTCDSETECISCVEGYFLDGIQCIQCSYKCQSCVSLEQCIECSSLDTRDTQNSQCECLPEFYQLEEQQDCIQCEYPCITCTAQNVCETCEEHYFLDSETQQCLECHNSCESCENSSRNCTICASETTRQSIYQDCECLSGYFQEGQNSECTQCELPCEICTSNDHCLSCISGFYLYQQQCYSCQSPCQECSFLSVCTSCENPLMDINTNCSQCQEIYFWDDEQEECISCEQTYGDHCGTCNSNRCLTCKNNRSYSLPDCITNQCQEGKFMSNQTCENCSQYCSLCQSENVCENCNDGYYLSQYQCLQCSDKCETCYLYDYCRECKKSNYISPSCETCEDGFGILEGECVENPGQGYFFDPIPTEWKKCDDTCQTCNGPDDNNCEECKEGLSFQNGQCLRCNQILGMTQAKGQPEGTCVEKCGDGVRLVGSDIEQCDDGNTRNGDGCSDDCTVEENYECISLEPNGRDICFDMRPIKYRITDNFDDLYLNYHKNAPLIMKCVFNRPFNILNGYSLKDIFRVDIEGLAGDWFDFKIFPSRRRILELNENSNENQINTLEYDIELYSKRSLNQRKLNVYFENEQLSGAAPPGKTLGVSENQKKQEGNVKKYIHYTDEERADNNKFQWISTISIIFLMISLSIFIFRYKNYFNRFYNLYFIIDIIQLLYFYRFINVRWAINGVFFFLNLKPMITFYLKNFHETKIEERSQENSGTGLEKFDYEGENGLFQNNAGSLLTLMYLLLFALLVCRFFTIKILYKEPHKSKIFRFFYQIRFGYLEWGIVFDILLASSGVFFFYFILQYTQTGDNTSLVTSHYVAIVLIAFFGYTLKYTIQNRKNLYTYQTEEENQQDEEKRDMKLQQKVEQYKSFKFRNIWHFVHNVQNNPCKSLIYFVFLLRKIVVSIIIVSCQNSPKGQIFSIAGFHLVIILILARYKIFEQKREFWKVFSGEILVGCGVAAMYLLTDDSSENEPQRLRICWAILGLWLAALIGKFFLFLLQEIMVTVRTYQYKKKGYKEKGFRFTRAYCEVTRKQIRDETLIMTNNNNHMNSRNSTDRLKETDRQLTLISSYNNNLNDNLNNNNNIDNNSSSRFDTISNEKRGSYTQRSIRRSKTTNIESLNSIPLFSNVLRVSNNSNFTNNSQQTAGSNNNIKNNNYIEGDDNNSKQESIQGQRRLSRKNSGKNNSNNNNTMGDSQGKRKRRQSLINIAQQSMKNQGALKHYDSDDFLAPVDNSDTPRMAQNNQQQYKKRDSNRRNTISSPLKYQFSKVKDYQKNSDSEDNKEKQVSGLNTEFLKNQNNFVGVTSSDNDSQQETVPFQRNRRSSHKPKTTVIQRSRFSFMNTNE